MSMKASMKYVTGKDSLEGKKIAIQGAGHVASYLAKYFQKKGLNFSFLIFILKKLKI